MVSDAFDNEGDVLNLDAKISLNHITAPVMLVVTLPLETVRPYLFAGGSFGIAVGNKATGTRTNFMGFPGPPHQVLQFVEDIRAYNFKIAVYDLAWRVGGGMEFTLNEKLDLLIECHYISGKNDSSENAQGFFSSKTLGITGGVIF